MKIIPRIVTTVILSALVLAFAYRVGYQIALFKQEPEGEIVEQVEQPVEEFDLQLLNEKELRVVTEEEVTVKLNQIGELATCEETYQVSHSEDSSRTHLDDRKVWWTKNTISLTCEGVVKVGYDISCIDIEVVPGTETEDETGKIFISIPEAEILDNYIIWESVECVEKNNILHPIEFGQYQSMFADIEALGLQQAVDNGIYETADEHIKTVITAFLSEFTDYEVIFMES